MGSLPDVRQFLRNTIADSSNAARALPDVHKFLMDRHQNAVHIWDFMTEEQEQMSKNPKHWDRPAIHMTDKGKKHAVSREASGSGSGRQVGSGRLGGDGRRAGSGRRAGYSAGHEQREEPD